MPRERRVVKVNLVEEQAVLLDDDQYTLALDDALESLANSKSLPKLAAR